MQKTTKKSTSLLVNAGAKVKPTKAAKSFNVTRDESFHYFLQPHGNPIAAMNIETAIDLSNVIYKIFPGIDKEELQSNQNLVFALLKNAVSNNDLDDSSEAGLYVELCSNLSQILNVCFQIRKDTNGLNQ